MIRVKCITEIQNSPCPVSLLISREPFY